MLDTYSHNIICLMLVTTAREKGDINVSKGDRVLYGGAPLPYATGLMPSLVKEEINLEWLPDPNEKNGLSFSERIKKGFTMAHKGGIDFFFGIGSVANYITENFSSASSGKSKGKIKVSPDIALRYLKARYLSRRDQRPVQPGDIFRPKAFICAGTDAHCYRSRLAKAWGTEPFELAAGTESTCIGTETWEHNGMYFFPDACFYEFIPEDEIQHCLENKDYQPRTCLMNEVRTGGLYELVISVLKGGAFMRYRIGDVYRCVSAGTAGSLPTFTFDDRVSSVIDIAGFTRLTESTIGDVVALSKLGINDWLAKKEYSHEGQPYLHMYIELTPEAVTGDAVSRRPGGASAFYFSTITAIITTLAAAQYEPLSDDYSRREPSLIKADRRTLQRINRPLLHRELLNCRESEPCVIVREVKAI